MRTISKMAVSLVFVGLLLSWVGGMQRPLHSAHTRQRSRRECHRVCMQWRRCRGDNPIHHPVRPCKNAVLPPDDDNIDPDRPHAKGSLQRLPASAPEIIPGSLSRMFGPRPLPTEVPRHQTLCILLI